MIHKMAVMSSSFHGPDWYVTQQQIFVLEKSIRVRVNQAILVWSSMEINTCDFHRHCDGFEFFAIFGANVNSCISHYWRPYAEFLYGKYNAQQISDFFSYVL
jgi:hypothetical protein